jgi:hypothetical protein
MQLYLNSLVSAMIEAPRVYVLGDVFVEFVGN